MDSLAVEGTVFEHAIATCPATGPSVASIITGVHRAAHGVMRNGVRLRSEVTTLAEVLREHGFRTAAVLANPVVSGKGFEQGFDAFDMAPDLKRGGPAMFEGSAVVKQARRLLDDVGEKRFFLWVHFMDPHGPYFPPARYRARFPTTSYLRPGEKRLPLSASNYGYGIIPKYQRLRRLDHPAGYRARYDAEIRYTDDLVRGLVRLLERRGLWRRTIFVLTADHGESLGDHGVYFQHGWHAYDGTLRVPLLIRAPGLVPAGGRVDASVSLVDVAPTILDLLGILSPPGIEGRSLRPLMAGTGTDRSAFAQTYYGNRLIVLQRGPWKYILTPGPPVRRRSLPGFPSVKYGPQDPRGGDGWKQHWPTQRREELYHLPIDPGETHNLARERPAVTRRFRRKLRRWLKGQEIRARRRIARDGAEAAAKRTLWETPSRTTTQQLRALGYLD